MQINTYIDKKHSIKKYFNAMHEKNTIVSNKKNQKIF